MIWVGQILFIRRTALAVGLCAALSACGQRGDLYLPNTPEANARTRLPGVVFMPGKAVAASEPAQPGSSPAR